MSDQNSETRICRFSPKYIAAFFALLEKVVSRELQIELREYYKMQQGVNETLFKKWNPRYVEKEPRLAAVLTKNGTKKLLSEVVSSAHLVDLLNRYSQNTELLSLIKELRKIEIKIRNPVSHCITYMTEDVIRKATGITAMQIFNKLKSLMAYCGIKVNSEDLKTYDICNERIIHLLESGKLD